MYYIIIYNIQMDIIMKIYDALGIALATTGILAKNFLNDQTKISCETNYYYNYLGNVNPLAYVYYYFMPSKWAEITAIASRCRPLRIAQEILSCLALSGILIPVGTRIVQSLRRKPQNPRQPLPDLRNNDNPSPPPARILPRRRGPELISGGAWR